jgi:transcription initiation factor TFIIE subunit alpha
LKEDDLAELLRIDLKIVHQHLLNLKREKFINEKSIMITQSPDEQQQNAVDAPPKYESKWAIQARTTKHSYFYINYKMMVNVIKYKLDKIRILIESEESQFTTRANFKCTQCKKTYSDLDTKDIFLTMQCLYCGADVDEDVSALPKRSAGHLLNKFNTQMAPLFELLSRVEHVRLADFLLRPNPVDMTLVLERINTANGTKPAPLDPTKKAANLVKFDKWSGDKTRHTNVDIFGQTQISINFDSTDAGSSSSALKKPRELPSILLLNRTKEDDLDGSNDRDAMLLNSVMKAADEISLANESVSELNHHHHHHHTSNSTVNNNNNNNSTATKLPTSSNPPVLSSLNPSGSNANELEAIIMQKLLKHEKKTDFQQQNETDKSDTTTTTTTTTAPTTNSSITITKKRNLSLVQPLVNNNFTELPEDLIQKKRRLNNGAFETPMATTNGYHNRQSLNKNNFRRNNSDGSDRDDLDFGDSEDTNLTFYSEVGSGGFDSTTNSQTCMSSPDDYDEEDSNMCNNNNNNNNNNKNNVTQFIPRVTVRQKLFRLDRITPKLISLMNEHEKESYINICRQLYSEIYEI